MQGSLGRLASRRQGSPWCVAFLCSLRTLPWDSCLCRVEAVLTIIQGATKLCDRTESRGNRYIRHPSSIFAGLVTSFLIRALNSKPGGHESTMNSKEVSAIVLLQSSKIYVSTYRTSCSHIYKIQYVIVLRVTHAQDQDQPKTRWLKPKFAASHHNFHFDTFNTPINTQTLQKLVSLGLSRLRGGSPISG